MNFKPVQLAKAESPIVVIPLGIVIESIDIQSAKVARGTVVSPCPITTDFSDVQPVNTLVDISVTLLGITNDSKLLHPMNASPLILFIPSFKLTDFKFVQFMKAP